MHDVAELVKGKVKRELGNLLGLGESRFVGLNLLGLCDFCVCALSGLLLGGDGFLNDTKLFGMLIKSIPACRRG